MKSLALPREAPESKVFSSLRGNLGNSACIVSQSVSTANPKQSPTKEQRSAGAFPVVVEDDPDRWSVGLSDEAPTFESREFASAIAVPDGSGPFPTRAFAEAVAKQQGGAA